MVRLWDESQGVIRYETGTRIVAWVEGVFYRMPMISVEHETSRYAPHAPYVEALAGKKEKEKEED